MLQFVSSLLLLSPIGVFPAQHGVHQTVPQCRDVVLRAAYLAEAKPGEGAGFQVEIANNRATPIGVAEPVPLSVHWYAFSRGRWLWRSSSGSGGALVNAYSLAGPVFAVPFTRQTISVRTIAPHESYRWIAFAGEQPELRYRPGCQHCSYQGESNFRAVLAYAYLPSASTTVPNLLDCGLRSNPIAMPPLAASQDTHNSGR